LNTCRPRRLLLDAGRLERNIARMQAVCDAHGVHLWPHLKTHKMVEVARMQLDAGARGLCCAKIGEGEAMLPSGVRDLFIAYPLVDPLHGPRLRALAEKLDTLLVACTSPAQAEALERVLAAVDLHLPVLMAVDTGLGREGVRGADAAGPSPPRSRGSRTWSFAACSPTKAAPTPTPRGTASRPPRPPRTSA
jgi:D-serine deaminase-like pyridoxal phosphate-dependent protein